ncbi:MAG: toprim domain-containing protein [Pseudodesulfovibrio sp.]|nr:toprim domain-containing protein [Pseudodesulfovibrio sp.]
MTTFRNDIGAEEVTRALLADSNLGFVQQGNMLRKGVCPGCGKKELFVSTEKPWRVECGRKNKCGWTSSTRELLPEVFANFSDRYQATEAEPDKTASAYLGMNRGFDLSKIRGWYEQGAFMIRGSNQYLNTVRFYLDKDQDIYWERFIDKKPKDGRKANFNGKYGGMVWTPPEFKLQEKDRCFLVEGCFHAIALHHAEKKAAACLSCVNFPAQLIEANKGKNITWVIALDGDQAGRKDAKKHAKRLKEMGEKFEVLLLPDNGMDWDDYYRDHKLTSKFIKDRLYYGKLFMAEGVEEKAYHLYCRKRYRTFSLEFENSLYSITIDKDVLDADLNPKKRNDGESDPAPIDLESRQGWDVFIRCIDVETISNTYPRFLYMERDPIMDEQRYVFQINYSNGNPSDIIGLEGTNITSPDAFHKSLLNKSRGGTFDGDVKQLKFLRDGWLNRRMKTVAAIPFVGYDHDTRAYVYQDAAYHNGHEIPLNRDGYFQVGKHGIKTSLNGTHITTDGEFNPDWLDNYFKAFHWQGLVLLAFWLGSLFAQQVRAMHKSLPFMEFTGEPGAGKSTALEFLWKCCGRDDHEGFDVMKATVAGRRRAFNQVSNLPVVIIESDRDTGEKDAKAKQFDFDLCKPFFNGRGTGTLGVAKRGNDVEESPFRAALIISQNAEVDGSEALLQRVVHVHVDKRHHTPDSRDIARWFERQTTSTVGGFLRKALQNERRILQVYEEAYHRYEAEFGKSTKIRNERIVKNHAQIAAFGAALEVLFPAMDKDRQAKLAAYILERAEKRELRLAADHPLIEQFWETVQYLDNFHDKTAKDWMNHSEKPEFIAINLNHFRAQCQAHGQELIDLKLLKKLLPQTKRHKLVEKSRVIQSVHQQRSIRCWVFKR